MKDLLTSSVISSRVGHRSPRNKFTHTHTHVHTHAHVHTLGVFSPYASFAVSGSTWRGGQRPRRARQRRRREETPRGWSSVGPRWRRPLLSSQSGRPSGWGNTHTLMYYLCNTSFTNILTAPYIHCGEKTHDARKSILLTQRSLSSSYRR